MVYTEMSSGDTIAILIEDEGGYVLNDSDRQSR
jgi:hypothetical protein